MLKITLSNGHPHTEHRAGGIAFTRDPIVLHPKDLTSATLVALLSNRLLQIEIGPVLELDGLADLCDALYERMWALRASVGMADKSLRAPISCDSPVEAAAELEKAHAAWLAPIPLEEDGGAA